MSIFGKVFKLGLDVVTSPIEVAKDIVTLGGALTDQDKPYTFKRLERMNEDIEDVRDEVGKL
jgi:hypothetical protein